MPVHWPLRVQADHDGAPGRSANRRWNKYCLMDALETLSTAEAYGCDGRREGNVIGGDSRSGPAPPFRPRRGPRRGCGRRGWGRDIRRDETRESCRYRCVHLRRNRREPHLSKLNPSTLFLLQCNNVRGPKWVSAFDPRFASASGHFLRRPVSWLLGSQAHRNYPRAVRRRPASKRPLAHRQPNRDGHGLAWVQFRSTSGDQRLLRPAAGLLRYLGK